MMSNLRMNWRLQYFLTMSCLVAHASQSCTPRNSSNFLSRVHNIDVESSEHHVYAMISSQCKLVHHIIEQFVFVHVGSKNITMGNAI